MTKYHLTDDGPRPCTASLRACPLGGEHFDSLADAQSEFEATRDSGLFGVSKSSVNKIVTVVSPMAGGRYWGCHVSNHAIEEQRQTFRALVGEDRADHLEALKAQRDRGHVYHLTVVGPPEMKSLPSGSSMPESVAFELKGVGRATDGKNEAWFIVCSSPELNKWRESVGLAPKDFHITLGFDAKDVHNVAKDETTLVTR